MAQKGRFVEDVQTSNTDFTSASKGQVSDKSLGSLFSTVGDTVGSAIQIADRQYQQTIEKKVNSFYEEETADQDPALMDFAAQGVPQELTGGVDNIIKMSKAYGNGLISDTQFYMRAAALAKRLKQQYPGHKDYVDAAINKARGSSANVARSALLREIESLKGSQDKANDYWTKESFKLQAEGHLSQGEISSMSPENAARLGAQRKGEYEAQQRKHQTVVQNHQEGNISDEQFAKHYQTTVVPDLLKNTFSNIFRETFPNSQGASLYDFATMLAGTKYEDLSVEQRTALPQIARSLRQQLSVSLQKSTGWDRLQPEARTKALGTINEFLDQMDNAIANKDMGMVGDLTRSLQIQQENAKYRHLTDEPSYLIGRKQAIKEIFGENSATYQSISQEVEKRFGDRQIQDVANWTVSYLIDGDRSVTELFDNLRNNTEMDNADKAKVMKFTFDTANKALTEKRNDSLEFETVARGLFRDNPDQLLKHWEGQDAKLQVFNSLIRPEVQSKLLTASPEISLAYSNWVVNSFKNIFAAETGDLNNAVTRFTQTASRGNKSNLKYDPKTQQFSLVINEGGNDFGLGATNEQARIATAKVNQALSKIMPVLKANNKDPIVAAAELVNGMGVSINPETGEMDTSRVPSPWIKSIAEGIKEELKKRWQNLQGRESLNANQ